MNWSLIGQLIRLRYKLMWAKTRSRNGRIAIFFIGYLIFILVMLVLALGGIGAGVVAIQSGRAETVTQIVLSALFLNAILANVIMGFGLSAAFSDTELRRYPLTAPERFVARHFLGIVDPFWFLILALDLGLAVGLFAWGSFSLLTGTAAVVLLTLCSYLFAQALSVWIDRLLANESGYAIVILLIVFVAMAPSITAAVLRGNHAAVSKLLAILRFTPPFGAAAAMTHTGSDMFFGFAIVIVWTVALFAIVAALERRPAAVKKIVRTGGLEWDSRWDTIARIFGPRMGPLVAFWLRFYWRNSRFRVLYFLSLPMAAFFSFSVGQPRRAGGSLFLGVYGAMGIVAFLGTSRICVNQFGYAGGALRRFFLFPTDAAASLRAGSYTALLFGAAWIPVAAIAWTIFAPRPLDGAIVFMPVLNAIAVMFLFHGFGLWTSIYSPKRGNYDKSFGNDLSLAGNIALIGTILGCMLLPQLLRKSAPWVFDSRNWWISLVAAALGICFYLFSLRAVTTIFPRRRETLVAAVEGKS